MPGQKMRVGSRALLTVVHSQAEGYKGNNRIGFGLAVGLDLPAKIDARLDFVETEKSVSLILVSWLKKIMQYGKIAYNRD